MTEQVPEQPQPEQPVQDQQPVANGPSDPPPLVDAPPDPTEPPAYPAEPQAEPTTPGASPEPPAEDQSSGGQELSEPVRADEPVIITPVETPLAEQETVESPVPQPQDPMAGGVGAEQPEVTGPEPVTPAQTMGQATGGAEGIVAETVNPSILVRLGDVLAHIENFAARHPELERVLFAELKSNVATSERLGPTGGAAPVGDTHAQTMENAEAADTEPVLAEQPEPEPEPEHAVEAPEPVV